MSWSNNLGGSWARRHLVNERGVPKGDITFCGYWRAAH